MRNKKRNQDFVRNLAEQKLNEIPFRRYRKLGKFRIGYFRKTKRNRKFVMNHYETKKKSSLEKVFFQSSEAYM
jgi:hypothetical protein